MGKYEGASRVALKPRTTEQAAALLRHCNQRRLAVVPQASRAGWRWRCHRPAASKEDIIHVLTPRRGAWWHQPANNDICVSPLPPCTPRRKYPHFLPACLPACAGRQHGACGRQRARV